MKQTTTHFQSRATSRRDRFGLPPRCSWQVGCLLDYCPWDQSSAAMPRKGPAEKEGREGSNGTSGEVKRQPRSHRWNLPTLETRLRGIKTVFHTTTNAIRTGPVRKVRSKEKHLLRPSENLPQHEAQVKQRYIGEKPTVQLWCYYLLGCRSALSSVSETEDVVD